MVFGEATSGIADKKHLCEFWLDYNLIKNKYV